MVAYDSTGYGDGHVEQQRWYQSGYSQGDQSLIVSLQWHDRIDSSEVTFVIAGLVFWLVEWIVILS